MGLLREEYKRNSQEKKAALNEAAVQWVLDNVLLLNEGFNRESLQKLQAAIVKFDSIFAPFGAKVPEVQRSLDDTVELMNRITMGEKITKKDGTLKLSKDERDSIKEPATYVVKYLSIMYNNLSRFFNRDMRVLLDFPIFAKAKENPTTPLSDLAESDKMKKALLNALVPGTDVQAILKRMYRAMDVPSLNYQVIADQLLNLSYSDFKTLTHVDKVPLVATANPTNHAEVATGTNPKVQGDLTLTEEDEAILKEVGEVDPKQLQTIVQGIKKIKGIVGTFPELTKTNQALGQLESKALGFLSKGGVTAGPELRLIAASVNTVYDYFDKVADLLPQITEIIPKGQPLSEDQIKNLETFLQRVQGGITAKIANWFKSKMSLVPGLSPNEIATDIMNMVRSGQNSETPVKGGENLVNFVTRLNSLKLPPATTPSGEPTAANQASTAQPTGSGAPQGTAPAAPAGQTTAANATGQTQATSQQQAPAQSTPDVTNLAQLMGQTIGINGGNKDFVDQVSKLVAAGWKLNPPGAAGR